MINSEDSFIISRAMVEATDKVAFDTINFFCHFVLIEKMRIVKLVKHICQKDLPELDVL